LTRKFREIRAIRGRIFGANKLHCDFKNTLHLEATAVVFLKNLNIIDGNFPESLGLRAMDQAIGYPHEKKPE
jgi:hypothetical protein